MNSIRWALRVAVTLAASIVLAAPALAQKYTITDLGVLSSIGDTESSATAINATGTVIGRSYGNPSSSQFPTDDGFVWVPDSNNGTTGTIKSLGGLPGDYCFWPPSIDPLTGVLRPGFNVRYPTPVFGINSIGDVVGYSHTSNGTCTRGVDHGVLYASGATKDLGVPLGFSNSYAYSINNAGQIVGSALSSDVSPAIVAWLFDGSHHILGTLPGIRNSGINKINNNGTMVGESGVGFVHTGTGPLQPSDAIGTLGGTTSVPTDINDDGLIVGYSTISDFVTNHAFLMDQTGNMIDLGTASKNPSSNSRANAINNTSFKPNIVGWSDIDSDQAWLQTRHAVLWESSGNLIDLNSFLDPSANPPIAPPVGTVDQCATCWELTNATGINYVGQIVGEGMLNGQRHAFLLTPLCAAAGGDTDGDGLCDDWEKFGYTTPDGKFVNLPAMGADPLHKDIFVQTDYMVDNAKVCLPPPALPGDCTFGHTHKPNPAAIAAVVAAFANAPVDNPDGKTGISLHVDCGKDCIMNPLTGETWGQLSKANSVPEVGIVGSMIEDPTCLPLGDCPYDWTDFQNNFRAKYFPSERIPAFHYALFAHTLGIYDDQGLLNVSGASESTPDSNFVVSLGIYAGEVGTSRQQAGTFMHELGHNLGLKHGGLDDTNFKPNYLSVMNYLFQMGGVPTSTPAGYLDYSRFPAIPDLNENSLNENIGLDAGPVLANYGTSYYCPGGFASNNPLLDKGRRDVPVANGPIDWDCNGFIDPSNVQASINADSFIDVLTSSEDWNHLIYAGGDIGALGVGAPAPASKPNTESRVPVDSQAPFQVSVVGPGTAQALPGASLNLTFTITNTGVQQDTYDLSANSFYTWWILGGVPNSLALAGGASQQIVVPGTVPLSTGCVVPGPTSQFMIGAVSRSHPWISDSAVAIVTVTLNPGFFPVPYVTGLTQAQAQAALVGAGLVVGTVTTQYSNSVAAGTVISQSPAVCTDVAAGSSVSLVVSLGPNFISIPNLVGQTNVAASAAITGLGLTVGSITPAMSSTVPQFDVISQSPAAGAQVLPGSKVNLVFSSGTQQFIQVPDVTGGFTALYAAGLTVGTITRELSSTVTQFTLISQNPPAGSFVAVGSAVDIVVSVGPQLQPVPNEVGQSEWFAFQQIVAANFEVTVTRQPSTTVPDGYVISQNPVGGASALLTSPVNLVVSSGGPVIAVVPNIVGMRTNIAEPGLYAAGFAIGSVTTQPSLDIPPAPAFQILSQNPPAGTSAPWDTSVSYVFSTGPPSTVVVPNIVGMTKAEAVTALNGASLTYAFTTQSSQTVPAGMIISQDPPAGPATMATYAFSVIAPVNFVISSGTLDVPTYRYSNQFGESGFGQKGQFVGITSLAIDPANRDIVVGDSNGRVQIFDSNGGFKSYFGGTSLFGLFAGVFGSSWFNFFPGDRTGDGLFAGRADAIAIDPVNRNIVVVDNPGNRVLIFNSAGQFQSVFGSYGSAAGQFVFGPLNQAGVAIDPTSENIIVTDNSNNRIQIFDSSGVFLSQFGTVGIGNGQFELPSGVAVDGVTHNIVVVDEGNNRIQIFNSAGVYLSQFGAVGTGNGQFTQAHGVAIDPVTHHITVAEQGNDRVQIFDSTGVYLSQFGGPGGGNGQMGGPGLSGSQAIAIDPTSHNILVADENNGLVSDRVEIFAPATLVIGPTTTTLVASLNPSTSGQLVTFTATVTGNSPTGTIQFMDGTASLGAQVPLSGAVANLNLSSLSIGTHSITAVYSGDSSNATSTSTPVSEVVLPPPTPPVVTPPASISIPATEAGGATGNAWPALAAFLVGGSAVASAGPPPTRLAPQVADLAADNTTLFPVGTTSVTFRFQDASGNIGIATSSVTVSLGTPRITGSIAGVGTDPSSGAIYVDVVLTNTGTGNARNLKINALLLRTLSGSGTITYNSALSPSVPITIGKLDVGTAVTTRVYLNVPATATRIAVTENGPVQDVLGTNYAYSTSEALVP